MTRICGNGAEKLSSTNPKTCAVTADPEESRGHGHGHGHFNVRNDLVSEESKSTRVQEPLHHGPEETRHCHM